MPHKKSLLSKMLLFIGVPVAIILCLTAVIVLSNVNQSVTQLTTSQLTAQSQAASYQINNYFSKYSEVAKQMQSNDSFQQYFQKSATEQIVAQNYSSILQTVGNIYKTDPDNYSTVWVTDCETNMMVINNKTAPINFISSERPWYQTVVAKKGVTIIEPYKDSVTGNMVMSMIAPIYKTETDELLGFAGIDITIDQLYKTVQGYKLGKTGFYILSTAAGQLIYYPDTALKGKNVSESNMSKNIISAIQNKSVGNITYTAMNQTNYGYVSSIGTTGWTVATGLPEKEFGSTYKAVQTSVFTIFIIALLVMLLLIVLMSNSIVHPLKKLTDTAKKIADGDLNIQVETKSSDEIGQVAEAISRTVVRLKQYIQYIDEVSAVLDQIALGNLVFELQCDYVGEFSKIKTSLENIQSTLIVTFTGITDSANQVASGSDQVANASQALAQGATEQASAIQQLSASITEIAGQVNQNASNATNADQLAKDSSCEVERGNVHMQNLISAMTEISGTSNQIGKIIKTIEDIAFQTNILALNAAVEAARAGTAGKGFAVVADEVRNLASKSAQAAESTTTLIETSIQSVNNGTKIANEMAESLHTIVDGVNKTSLLIAEISKASSEQAASISQVTLGVDQISAVVQTNSATSEESAASSEELNGQAQTMKSLVATFKTGQEREASPTGDPGYTSKNSTDRKY